jgi:hypothetical protein
MNPEEIATVRAEGLHLNEAAIGAILSETTGAIKQVFSLHGQNSQLQ